MTPLSACRPQRALITGASGFVGGALSRHLIDVGWEIHIVLRKDPGDQRGPLSGFPEERIHLLSGDTDDLREIIRITKPDVVFHLASLFLSEHTPDDLNNLVSSNILFGTRLVEAMTQNGCLKLVNTGTSWQHFGNSSFSPVNLYSATKQAFEDILKYYVEARQLKVITLKLFDTYGPGDRRKKLIPALLKACRSGETLDLTSGENRLDLVYIEDVCRAFEIAAVRLLLDQGGPEEAYAVSSGISHSLKHVVKTLSNIAGSSLKANWGTRPYREREVMIPWSTGSSLPGWNPRFDLEAGLKLTLKKQDI